MEISPFEKPRVVQPLEKFPVISGKGRFITVFTRGHHLLLY
jgi:hypothetical protein